MIEAVCEIALFFFLLSFWTQCLVLGTQDRGKDLRAKELLKLLWTSNRHLKHIWRYFGWAERPKLATLLCRKGCRRSSTITWLVASQGIGGYAQAASSTQPPGDAPQRVLSSARPTARGCGTEPRCWKERGEHGGHTFRAGVSTTGTAGMLRITGP